MLFRFLAFLLAVLPAILSATATSAEENAMRVLTFNIRYDNPRDGENRWANRREAVAGIIARADVAGLQEVLHRQLTDLKEALPSYSIVGVGRDDGKQAGEYSPVLYRTERFELQDSGTFWLSTTPEKIGSLGWDARIPRICTWVHLTDKESGKSFFYFNTHFDHRGSEARLESSKLIMKKVAALAGDTPVILGGDLNTLPGSEPIKTILAGGDAPERGLRDSRSATDDPIGPDSTWNGFRAISNGNRIDYLFVSSTIQVKTYQEIVERIDDQRFPSDHLPVTAKVTW